MHRYVRFVVPMLVAAVIVPGRVTAQGVDPRPANGANQKPAFAGQTDAPEQKLDVNFEVVTVADNINTGWSVAFLPDGKMLVTERGARRCPRPGWTAGRRTRPGLCDQQRDLLEFRGAAGRRRE